MTDPHMHNLGDDLAGEFDPGAREPVNRVVTNTLHSFADDRIRSYEPMLVRLQARERPRPGACKGCIA